MNFRNLYKNSIIELVILNCNFNSMLNLSSFVVILMYINGVSQLKNINLIRMF